ncbi:exonuclease SbcC [Roseivivax marinus]|uniref:AAA family ATPase n=1 Tax=Roseivivax marinus TaxID=1379903 RepID=UPI0008B84FA1|nr:AAA family ATPase [Roseivivax marinus]SEL89323.1 exonuclease SbcC [Roseivivax marinus]
MQILTIRGANLASLADTFEIDLTEEPLRSAGLFAITGKTGAGKSTILDALCLALYGSCPRLSSQGVNDDVPDIAGEFIKSSDPRAILRRGAAQGFAEVAFRAPDGMTYRASWTARRARGKAEGRLQNVERALTRVDDDTLIESQINAVRDRVTEITGLAYEEFRRTVLLAQGDFDAFLRANTPERAALLEKVTGTGIYRDISRRIYARHEEAKAALATLETKRSATNALADEARQAMREEADTLGKQIAATLAEIAGLEAKIQVHVAVTEARSRVAKAEAAERDARAAVEAAKDDRTTLGRIETALGLKSEQGRALSADRAVSDLEREEKAATDEQTLLAEALEKAVEAHRTAVTGAEEAERVFKAFGPQWTEATKLDELIVAAKGEAETAGRSRAEMATLQESAAKSLYELQGQDKTAAEAIERALEQMKRAPDAHLLADRWTQIQALLDERTEARKTESGARKRAIGARKEAADAEERRATLTTADGADRAKLAELEAARQKAQSSLDEISKDDPQARMDRLTKGEQGLKDMTRAAGAHDEETTGKTTAETRISEETAKQGSAADAHGKAEKEIARADAAIAALQAPVDRAEAAASDMAAELRRSLEPEAPCPVCGSKTHPVEADDALSRIAREMRQQLEAERRALETARRDLDAAARARDAAALAIKTATEVRDTAGKAIGDAECAFDEARHQTLESGLTQLPESPAGAKEALAALTSKLAARRTEISELIAEQARLRTALEETRKAVQTHTGAIETRAPKHEAQARIVSEKTSAASLADQEAAHAVRRIADIDREISPALAAVNVTPEKLDADPVGVRGKLDSVVQWWTTQISRRDTAEATRRELAPKIASASSAVTSAQSNLDTAMRAEKDRTDALDKLQAKRAEMLGGEDTETHRTRHNEARLKASEEKERLATALSEARSLKSGADARLKAASDALVPARTEQTEAKADLDAKLEKAGLGREELAVLLGKGAAEVTRLRDKLKSIDETMTGAVSTLAARQGDLKERLDKGLPEEAEPDLRAAKATREEARDEMRERTGAIAQALKADDALREHLKGLDAEIRAAKETCDTWRAVNEAVGSKQGGKFAQIAQAVTLSLLVERANLHLADLKPRYRLMQGGEDLALHIVDGDMGDEVRSTRSLSGGERFLVSLSLALALSQMGGQGGLAATLFIDEGFGSLDAEDLDIAMDALETLQAQGRTIGVISHVEAMKDRIPVQVRVTRRGAGASTIELAGAA